MFNNAGKKIKLVAEYGFWVEAVGSFITFLILCIDENEPLYLLAILGSIATAWLISLFVYGFGEIVDKHCDSSGKGITPAKSDKPVKPVVSDKRVEVSEKEYRQAKKEYNKSKKNSSAKYPTIQDEEEFAMDYADDGSTPQVKCPKCGTEHDFDYPKCPKCKYKY